MMRNLRLKGVFSKAENFRLIAKGRSVHLRLPLAGRIRLRLIEISPSRVLSYQCVILFTASVNEPSRVHIDARRAGRAKLTATAQSLKEEVPVKIEDNLDGTYDLMYIPPVSGAYLLNVKWDDHHIPGSPFKITAYSKTDPSQVGEFCHTLVNNLVTFCSMNIMLVIFSFNRWHRGLFEAQIKLSVTLTKFYN